MEYEDRIDLLLEKGIISNKDEVFFPCNDANYTELSDFFQKYLLSLSFGFSKPIFFFGSEKSLNAWACKYNGLDVICINKYALEFTYKLFDTHENFIIQYLSRNGINTNYDNGLPAIVIMKQMIEMFLFYHELGHLIQEQDPTLASFFTEEVYKKDEFDIIDHVSEYDSDLFASVRLVSHVFEVYKRQNGLEDDKTKARFLEDSCIITIASYILYRLNLFPDYGAFYTKASTHPHIIIRVNSLVIHFTKATIDNSAIELDRDRILIESISFVEEFSKVLPNSEITDSFIEMGKENIDIIAKYIYELNEIVISLDSTAHVKSQKRIKND